MSHNGGFLLLCIFLTELASELRSTLRTHTNSLMVVNTCAMLRNTRKATLNRIGTQRKKRGYKGGASYTYAKVRRCPNTQLAMMSMEVESKD
jgi:tRNA A37 methylthiotransferase MiaB